MLLGDIYETPAQFTNDIGVEFWLDESLTDYARSKGLMNVQVLFTRHPDTGDGTGQYKTRLVVEDGQPVFESQNLEAVGAHLDIMVMDKQFG